MSEYVRYPVDELFETEFTSKSQALGRLGESFTRQYLTDLLGWTILDTNWRLHRLPEIDVIARSNEAHIVFMEVKTRFSRETDQGAFDLGIQSCNKRKQAQIFRAARLYCVRNAIDEDVVKRFDLIALEIEKFVVINGEAGRVAQVKASDLKVFHIQSAFAPGQGF